MAVPGLLLYRGKYIKKVGRNKLYGKWEMTGNVVVMDGGQLSLRFVNGELVGKSDGMIYRFAGDKSAMECFTPAEEIKTGVSDFTGRWSAKYIHAGEALAQPAVFTVRTFNVSVNALSVDFAVDVEFPEKINMKPHSAKAGFGI